MFISPRAIISALRSRAADIAWAGDINTYRLLHNRTPGTHRITARFLNRKQALYIRGETLDINLARLILANDSEYQHQHVPNAKIIIDAGANIGATTLYLANIYPKAHIFAFEPLPDNFQLLQRNTHHLADRITPIPMGLSDAPGSFTFHPSNDPRNLGGGTFCSIGCDAQTAISLPVTTLKEFTQQHNIDQIDLLKLDVEGAEAAVLRGTPNHLINNCHTILGELHSHEDYALLQQLQETHRIGFNKKPDHHCYPFIAINKTPRQATQPSHPIATNTTESRAA